MSEIILTNELTAWGETKTIAEWARDERATADAKIIAKRYESGNTPEHAISYKVNLRHAVIRPGRAKEYPAFGERKILSEWSRDRRCCVSQWTLRNRVESGWNVEKALTTPPKYPLGRTPGPAKLIHAWGESKPAGTWANDSRCSVDQVTVRNRLRKGWEPERAISEPAPRAEFFSRISAFGETKTALEWTCDPRCEVCLTTLRNRLTRGMEVERALTTPPAAVGWAAGTERSPRKSFEWKGRIQTLGEWSRDPECRVSLATLSARIAAGWDFELAMQTRANDPKVISARKRRPYELVEYTAFGETKPLYEWVNDPRSKVSRETLVKRIKRGCSMQNALQTPAFGLQSGEVLPRYEAFGVTKTRREWTRDPRCRVAAQDLTKRIRAGWTIEDALTTPPHDFDRMSLINGVIISAFGEQKTAGQWARDSRCSVKHGTILRRLNGGIAPEEAISAPPGDVKGEDGSVRIYAQFMTAFGESKTLRDWIADPRCLAKKTHVRDRLRYGWTLERALTTAKMSAQEASRIRHA
ncbi:MAG: hypothetical protein K8R88_00440, partial [Armatimonadetes bacterium]|nr:hypothetical protein [Armatimonadota bacterium]